MKRIFLIASIAACAAFLPCHGRGFFSGSNPQTTVFAFPQDILLIPKDFVFYYTVFQQQPWWGDIDQFDLRPSTTYLLTGEKIGVKGSNDYFLHNSNLYNWKNTLGGTWTFKPDFKTRLDLDYNYIPLRSHAEGAMTNSSGNSLQFNYNNALSMHDFYLTSYWAFKWKDIPIGLKLGGGRQATTEPRLKWSITENGTTYEAQRQVWAWSTMQGGRMFENYPGDDHGRYEDEYSFGSLYRLDIQASATLPRLKVGGRFRLTTGKLDWYQWQPNTGSPVPDPVIEDKRGSYQDAYAKKIGEKTFRVYGNYNWIKEDNFLFNTFVLSRYTLLDSIRVDPANTSVETGIKEKSRTFVFQINPNINLYPWGNKYTYIDLAILCNYANMGYDYTRPYWVGGGQKDSYAETWTYYTPTDSTGAVIDTVWLTEDYAWYKCSYARQNFFEVALDINPTFPVFGDREQSLAVNVSLLLWLRFKWLNKYYGTGRTTSTDVFFDVQNIRKTFEREVWLNSVLNIIYRRGNYTFRLMFGQPLTYSLTPSTRIFDASGKKLVSEIQHENMWVSQSGAQIGLFVSTTLSNLLGKNMPANAAGR
jgi:hypothetical protein